jgi:tetratricopeptide (TPR) repeat protein
VRRARHRVEAATLSASHHRAALDACQEAATALQSAREFEQAGHWAARGSALAAESTTPAVEARLLLTHASAVLACGRLAEARTLYEAAVAPAERAGDHRLIALAALGFGGVWVEEQRDEISRRRMLGLCQRALAALGADDPVVSALLRVRLAAEHAYDGGPAEAVEAAVDEVRRLGEPAAIAEALSLYHHTLLAPAHAVQRLEIAEELLDAAVHAPGSIFSLFGLCWRTVDLYLVGDARAEHSFLDLREQTAALASRSIGYIAAVLDVMRTFRRGELEHAEALAADALALGEDAGDADAFAYYGGHLLGMRWVQGRLAEMGPMIDAVIDSATLRRRDRIYPAVRAYARAVEGDHAGARAAIDQLVDEGLESICDFSTGLATLAVLIETAAQLADGPLAEQLAELFRPFAGLPVMPSLAVVCLGPGERFLGLALATAGRLDEAIGCFRDALVANRRLQNRPVEALIHADLAAALRRRGRDGDELDAAEHHAVAIQLGTRFGLTARVARWEADAARLVDGAAPVAGVAGALEHQDGIWRVEINGRTATIDHMIGMRYVAALLARPDTDITAAALSAAVHEGLDVQPSAREAAALDAAARRDYQRRLADLECELDLADRLGDADRGRRAADERTALLDRLRRDSGLGGRSRRLSDDAERCRMRVSKAIQRAISRIEQADSVLGRALATRIRTGYVCRYESDPGQPIAWTVHVAA